MTPQPDTGKRSGPPDAVLIDILDAVGVDVPVVDRKARVADAKAQLVAAAADCQNDFWPDSPHYHALIRLLGAIDNLAAVLDDLVP